MASLVRRAFQKYKQIGNKYYIERGKLMRKMAPDSNVVKLNPENSAQWYSCVLAACEHLKRGQVVAIPTDTLYGLVALAEHADKLYRLKRRPDDKPLGSRQSELYKNKGFPLPGLFINDPEDISKFVKQTVPDRVLKTLFPGPVTVVFERSELIPAHFNPGVASVAFRVPQARFARDLCRELPRCLIAQTSANVSGSDRNPICVEDFRELWDDIDLIIDGGPILENRGSRSGSTIVDLSLPGQYRLLRAGCAPIETTQILYDFGLRSAEEVQRELLESGEVEKGKIAQEEGEKRALE